MFYIGETPQASIVSRNAVELDVESAVTDAASDVDSRRPAVDEEEQPANRQLIGPGTVVDDDAASASTEDVVNLAMSATLEEADGDDDDDEQILYPIQRKVSSE